MTRTNREASTSAVPDAQHVRPHLLPVAQIAKPKQRPVAAPHFRMAAEPVRARTWITLALVVALTVQQPGDGDWLHHHQFEMVALATGQMEKAPYHCI